jgi:hypothetical protein
VVQESVQSDFITVQDIEGKVNIADLFKKEDKDMEYFMTL